MLGSFWDMGNKHYSSWHTEADDQSPNVHDTEKPTNTSSLQHHSGIDIHKKIRAFSCKWKFRRWSFAVICNFVDVAYIIEW